MKQKVQLGALRAAPGAASLPRTGRGEALLVQQHLQQTQQPNSHKPALFAGGGARAALGPMPYGNMMHNITRAEPEQAEGAVFVVLAACTYLHLIKRARAWKGAARWQLCAVATSDEARLHDDARVGHLVAVLFLCCQVLRHELRALAPRLPLHLEHG